MPTQTTNSSSITAPKRDFFRRIKHHMNELTLTSPPYLWMVIFFLIPIILSFRSTAPGGGIVDEWTLLTWYTISNPSYPEIIWRTIIFSIIRIKHHMNELIVTTPSLLWMVIFFLIPTVLIFALSFRSTAPDGGIGDTWTLHTWKTISNPNYPEIVWRTIWLSIITTILCIVISIPCAFAMARASKRMRHVLVGLIILPFWTSFLVRVFAWKTLLHPEGLISKLFITLGFIQPTEQLLYNSGAVLIVMVYTYLPFAILPLYAAAEKFDYSLIEAALDLGSTPLRAFVQIFVPGIKAGIYSATLMVLIPALGSYVVPDIVGGTDSEMVGSKIYERAIPDRNLPHASALSALLFLGVLVPPFIAWCFIRRRNMNITETEAVEAAITEDNKRSKGKGGMRK